ncbi:MAG: putative ABC transport system ATP-binding protein [Pseudohongiellaceae bacterium]|jgi:putative ABC transport system ATP-binding protein
MSDHYPGKKEFRELFFAILSPEAGFYKVVLIYSLAISLLTLAVPISLQLLVDTVANIALVRAVVLISVLLFALLFISGVMYALRAYAMEIFTRKLYARVSSEIAMTAMLAESDYFEEYQNSDLFNRYFDILTLKKTVPNILTNGFTLILQLMIGFTVVSFYHFYFFIFCIVLISLIWLIWRIWGWSSINTAFRLSESKYKTAAWLQSLAVTNEAYRTSLNPSYPIVETDRLVNEHIDCQKKHFRNTYSQLLSFLFLYALASAVLLGMGGWLVIVGQLTLGQLVAAELIMSAIFVGLPQLAGYLDYFFDVCAAIEELSRFRDVRTQLPVTASTVKMPIDNSIEVSKVRLERFERSMAFDLSLPAHGVFRVVGNAISLKWLTELLRGNYQPGAGLITIGGTDNLDIDRQSLRQSIRIIDRVTLLPMSVKAYLELYISADSNYSRQQSLALMQLDDDILSLKGGIETVLSRSAWPLTQPQAIRLKLATALLSKPSVLVLGDIVDTVVPDIIEPFIEAMQKQGTSVLYFTCREDITRFTHKIEIDAHGQTVTELGEVQSQ